MNANSIFKDFHRYLRSSFPEAGINAHPEWDFEIKAFEEEYFSHVLAILQKSESFFEEERVVFGFDVSTVGSEHKADVWKHFQYCLFASFLSGDIQPKLSKLLGVVKGIWGGQGHSTDAIDEVLNDEEKKSKISELLEFLTTTRIATLAKQILEGLDLSELGISLESPEQLLDILKDPSNPIIETFTSKIKSLLEEKMKSGDFKQDALVHEIETIKIKVQDTFGDIANQFLGISTRADSTPSEVILSNHPDARRARMIARLQRKQKDKGGKTSY
jgi:hypothetical protein